MTSRSFFNNPSLKLWEIKKQGFSGDKLIRFFIGLVLLKSNFSVAKFISIFDWSTVSSIFLNELFVTITLIEVSFNVSSTVISLWSWSPFSFSATTRVLSSFRKRFTASFLSVELDRVAWLKVWRFSASFTLEVWLSCVLHSRSYDVNLCTGDVTWGYNWPWSFPRRKHLSAFGPAICVTAEHRGFLEQCSTQEWPLFTLDIVCITLQW